jgi:hypothetical protein
MLVEVIGGQLVGEGALNSLSALVATATISRVSVGLKGCLIPDVPNVSLRIHRPVNLTFKIKIL